MNPPLHHHPHRHQWRTSMPSSISSPGKRRRRSSASPAPDMSRRRRRRRRRRPTTKTKKPRSSSSTITAAGAGDPSSPSSTPPPKAIPPPPPPPSSSPATPSPTSGDPSRASSPRTPRTGAPAMSTGSAPASTPISPAMTASTTAASASSQISSSSSFNLSEFSGNLCNHAFHGSGHGGTAEKDIKDQIFNYLNVSGEEYGMVLTLSRGSAFKLLAGAYPFQTHRRLLTMLDHDSQYSVNWMAKIAREKGAKVRSACFKWPTLKLCSSEMKKTIKLRRRRPWRHGFVGALTFPAGFHHKGGSGI